MPYKQPFHTILNSLLEDILILSRSAAGMEPVKGKGYGRWAHWAQSRLCSVETVAKRILEQPGLVPMASAGGFVANRNRDDPKSAQFH